MRRVLVTGSAGVIGRALARALEARGVEVVGLDRAASPGDDLLAPGRVARALAGASGVVHLAACSRVAAAEARPDDAARDNVRATAALLDALAAAPGAPWLVFASSREVYGEAAEQPVADDAPLAPCNVYGCTKRDAERLVDDARARGLRAATLRLANVYGAPWDHDDRLVPALAAAARAGATLVVRGAERSLDLVHVDDAVEGIARAALALEAGRSLEPTLLASGVEVRLGALAVAIARAFGSSSPIAHEPAAAHEVARFVGRPLRAAEALGWRAEVPLDAGLARLVAATVAASG